MSYRAWLMVGGAVVAAGMLPASIVHAQEELRASSIEDIVVTARKRTELIQDVPAAITAVSSDQLSTYGVNNVQQLSSIAPGMVVSASAAVSGQAISMRGVSNQPSPQLPQTTAVYIDGVYLPRPDAAIFTLDDIERIEVLRGPQGTLYGRNSTSGAINIVSRLPGDTLRGGFDVRYGNYDHLYAAGSLSGPLGGGFSAGVSGVYDDRNGYYKDVSTENNHVDDATSKTLRGKLRYLSPDGDLDVRLVGDIVRGDTVEVTPFAPVASFPATQFSSDYPWQIKLPKAVEDALSSKRDQNGVALTVLYQANDQLSLTSISAWRDFKSHLVFAPGSASGLTPFLNVLVRSDNDIDTYAQELRAEYSSKAFELTLGGNFYKEDQYVFVDLQMSKAWSTVKQYAIFGNLTGHLTDSLDVDLGLRWNIESRDVRIEGLAPAPYAGSYKDRLSDKALIPHIGLNYKVAPDVLLYMSASKGYQAGSYNTTPADIDPNTAGAQWGVNLIKPENLWSYEVGMKAQFFDRRVTLNLAGFHSDYRNMQVKSSTLPGFVEYNNAGGAKIDGVEAEFSGRIAPGLSVFANASYIDAHYTNFCEAVGSGTPAVNDPVGAAGGCVGTDAQRKGNPLILAPKWTVSAGVDFKKDVGIGELHGNVSYAYRSSANFASGDNPLTSSGAYNSVNARLGLTIGSGPEIYVYGQNLANTWNTAYGQILSGPLVSQIKSDPRTYGVGMRYHF